MIEILLPAGSLSISWRARSLALASRSPSRRFVAHAQAVIDDDHRVQRLAVVELFFASGKERLGQGQAEQQHGRRAQQEQEDVADLHDPAVALHGFAEEIHGRPLHHFEPPPVQEVNDDRPGGADGPGERELPGGEGKEAQRIGSAGRVIEY